MKRISGKLRAGIAINLSILDFKIVKISSVILSASL